MKRTIVQISSILRADGLASALYALCDDGTLWVKPASEAQPEQAWIKIDDVPQPPAEPKGGIVFQDSHFIVIGAAGGYYWKDDRVNPPQWRGPFDTQDRAIQDAEYAMK